jgi:hypothetical protein
MCFGVSKARFRGSGAGSAAKALIGRGKDFLDEQFDSSQIERFHFASLSLFVKSAYFHCDPGAFRQTCFLRFFDPVVD